MRKLPAATRPGFILMMRAFLDHVARFIALGLKAGNAAIVVATKSHRDSLLWELQANGVLDPVRLLELFGDLIMTAGEAAKGEYPCISVFGKCVNFLCEQGNAYAAIQMEKLGNKLTQIHDVNILCAVFSQRF